MNIVKTIKLSVKKPVFAFLLIFAFVGAPVSANAGVLSFVGSLFDKKADKQVVKKETNSQNTKLLHAALNVDPNPAKGGGGIIIVGNTALLPESGPSGTLADVEESETSPDQISLYIVREGDSLSQIAKMFGVSTNTIIWANDIKRGDLVRVGQTLVIMPVSGVQHTVKKGDTINKITKRYKGNLDEVLEYNGFDKNTKLAVGDKVFIPNGVIKKTPIRRNYKSASKTRGISTKEYKGYYIRPLRGGIKTQGIHGYNAVDIAAPKGTPLFASASGNVTVARNYGWNGGYGKYVVIKHANGTQTLYAHQSKVIVKSGQPVVKGQIIGYVGTTGRSTGNHVHFEVRGAKNPF